MQRGRPSLGRAAAAHGGGEDPQQRGEARGPVLQGAGRTGPRECRGAARGSRGAGARCGARAAGRVRGAGVRAKGAASGAGRAGGGCGREPSSGGAARGGAAAGRLTWLPPGVPRRRRHARRPADRRHGVGGRGPLRGALPASPTASHSPSAACLAPYSRPAPQITGNIQRWRTVPRWCYLMSWTSARMGFFLQTPLRDRLIQLGVHSDKSAPSLCLLLRCRLLEQAIALPQASM